MAIAATIVTSSPLGLEREKKRMEKKKIDGVRVTVFNPLDPTPATCGHDDLMGFIAGTVCGECARANHRKAMGR